MRFAKCKILRPPRGALGRAPVLRTPQGERKGGLRKAQQPRPRANLFRQLLKLRPRARIGTLMALGKDHFILLGMFEAGEFRHPHLVAMGFQIKPAQHIGQLRAEFPPLNAVPP